MTTTNDIDAIRKQADAATPGPWTTGADKEWSDALAPWTLIIDANYPLTELEKGPQGTADAEFIAAARTLVPALCDEVEQLRAEVDLLRMQVYAQKPVIDAALNWAEMCEDGGLAPDDCRKSEDALHDAVESYRLMDMALTSARDEAEVAAR